MDNEKPDTPTPRIGTLQTAIDCRRELSKAYRQFRKGEIDDKTAKTSTYMLQALVNIIRDNELTKEVADLREQVEGMKT